MFPPSALVVTSASASRPPSTRPNAEYVLLPAPSSLPPVEQFQGSLQHAHPLAARETTILAPETASSPRLQERDGDRDYL